MVSDGGRLLGAEAQAVSPRPPPGTLSSQNKIPNPKFQTKINFGTQNLKFPTHLWYNISMGQE
nr:MAG TPA: hypothetical protein [Caudoviricetes sp.]